MDGHGLTPDQLEAVALERAPVELDSKAAGRMRASRALLQRLLDRGEPIYGVNTGFGRLAAARIAPEAQRELQRNMVRSHATGAGEPLPTGEVRAIMLLRANALARGHSGCRVRVAQRLLDMLNHGVHPVVPELGSVGASGDLGPLAHVALALLGEGRVRLKGATGDAARLLEQAGMAPLALVEKEGLALVNGTQATTGAGMLAVQRLGRALDAADVSGAMSLEGLLGTPTPFRRELHAARPHPGQIESAKRLRTLLRNSEIRESHRFGDPRVQDAYSLRCMPQVHGAAREALAYARRILSTEANSSTDNPLVLPEADAVLSGGNFHAQVVAQCLDLAAIAAADLASMAERRVDRMLNPDLSGLPAFLSPDPGLRSGLMSLQIVVADALAEMRVLASPASVDSVSTCASQEDHVSMGMASARKLRQSVRLLETVLACEFLCAAQAVEHHRPLRAGSGVERAHALVRRRAPRIDEDRPLTPDIAALTELVATGRLSNP